MGTNCICSRIHPYIHCERIHV